MICRTIAYIALAFVAAASVQARAESKLELRYAVSLTGVPIGQGALVVDLNDEGYSAAGSASVSGLMKLVSSGKGSAAARGRIVDGKIQPVTYSLSSEGGRRSEDIRMAMAAGSVRDFSVIPPSSRSADRIPVTDEHRKGVVDPMSAAILPVPGNGDPLSSEACNRTLAIFDGRVRYNLVMGYERIEPAKDVKGYSGSLVVCRITYEPVAGHRPSRSQVKQMAENKDIYAWLAPIAGSRVLVPVRVTVGTTIGKLVVQATQFTSEQRGRSAISPSMAK